jgi:hypothetical protein
VSGASVGRRPRMLPIRANSSAVGPRAAYGCCRMRFAQDLEAFADAEHGQAVPRRDDLTHYRGGPRDRASVQVVAIEEAARQVTAPMPPCHCRICSGRREILSSLRREVVQLHNAIDALIFRECVGQSCGDLGASRGGYL